MNGNLNYDSGKLQNVGNNFTTVAQDVRATFTNMIKTVDQVTANESWKGLASEKFLQKFENIRPQFEEHLQKLEELGPVINEIATGYSNVEEENASMM